MTHRGKTSRFSLLPALLLGASLCRAAAPVSGLDTAGFDPSLRVQDDLFRAVNGGWLKRTEIPADKSIYGTATLLRDLSDQRVRVITEELTAKPQALGGVEQKIASFYGAYTDTAAIDRAGLAPAKAVLDSIQAIQTRADLARWLGQSMGQFDIPIELAVTADFKNPGVNRALTWQSGLGLPDRDYYLLPDERMRKARGAYELYLSTLAKLAGEPAPQEMAKQVLALETRIAEVHWPTADNRDPVKIYNPMTLGELAALAPGFDWQGFVQAAGLVNVTTLSVSHPSAMTGTAKLLGDVDLALWRQYLRLRVLDGAAEVLPQAVREARFAFRGTALTGTTQELPRWQKGIAQVNAALGEALGKVYVARHFPPEHKTRMSQLVGNLMSAYAESIRGLAWMTPATRAAALEKLSKYAIKIGYPDRWRDYSGLDVRAGDAFGNLTRSGRFEWLRMAAKAGQPVDRSEWDMTPQTVNAYYNPTMNEIVFPAAILQPPFFDVQADDAVNYGAIGAVIGHEISHGFDDKGSQFDGDGMLRNWWTDADRKAFDAFGAQLVAQYEKYEPIAGKTLNGKLTLGENIADLSGLQIAYKAYLRSLGGQPAPVIGGFSGQQRFFMGWSQAWRTKVREERALQLLTTDPHSPPQYRANGAAVNHDGFHEAFKTQPGDAMFKPTAERVRIW